MTQFALVQILDEKRVPFTEFFRRYVEHLRAENFAPGTIKNVGFLIARFTKFYSKQISPTACLSDLTPLLAEEWKLSMLGQHFTNNTVRTTLCCIKNAYEYAISLNLASDNPMLRIKLPEMTFAGRVLEDRLLKPFIRALRPDVRKAAKLSLYTGMRLSEVLGLQWYQISRGVLWIPAFKAKNRKDRYIYLSAQARRCLGSRGHASPQDRVFNFTRSVVHLDFQRAGVKTKIGRLRFHDLRHIAATKHYEKNKDPKAMMNTFGWSTESSTAPYRHDIPKLEKAAMSRMTYAL